jgi:hypothetical protein
VTAWVLLFAVWFCAWGKGGDLVSDCNCCGGSHGQLRYLAALSLHREWRHPASQGSLPTRLLPFPILPSATKEGHKHNTRTEQVFRFGTALAWGTKSRACDSMLRKSRCGARRPATKARACFPDVPPNILTPHAFRGGAHNTHRPTTHTDRQPCITKGEEFNDGKAKCFLASTRCLRNFLKEWSPPSTSPPSLVLSCIINCGTTTCNPAE